MFDDYNRHLIVKGSETLMADSRDTPQFQHDSLSHQLNNSSLYVRTSGPSSIKGVSRSGRRASNKGIVTNSQFNSINMPPRIAIEADLYCETTEKKDGTRKALSST